MKPRTTINQLTILLAALLLTSSVFAQKDKRLRGVDKELEEILDMTEAASFAVAVVDGDEVIYAKGFGFSDIEKGVEANENTLYAIGSCSKAFTSAVLGQLEDEGELSFEDRPGDHVDDIVFYNDELNTYVNIRDLMAHRTGIPRHDISWYLFPTFDRNALMKRIEYHEPFTGLRQQWYYNNFMFLLQGVIAERITEQSWEDNIRNRFFKPLGMTRSNVSIAELEKADNAAKGYEADDDGKPELTPYYQIGGMAPAGSINSSVVEMSAWLKTWINKGMYGEEQILPESYRDEAISSHMVIDGALPDEEFEDIHFATYGYGWMMMSYKGHYRVEHGGNIDGFSASTCFFPSDSIGVVVLTNQGGSSVPGLVRNTIVDRMLDVEKTDWIKRYKDRMAEREKRDQEEEVEPVEEAEVKVPAHELDAYTGYYSNKGYGDFEVKMRGDSLFVDLQRMTLYLRHLHYDIFDPLEVKNGEIQEEDGGSFFFNFRTNDGGDIESVSIQFEQMLDHPIYFDRTPKPVELTEAELQMYTGEFDFGGPVISFYTKDSPTLYAFIEGQPEYELIYLGKDEFQLKDLNGYKAKFVIEEGIVKAVNMIQPNGTFEAKKKEE